jgi:transcriptional regulator with PAS, ATPase and Fis domain
METRYKETRSPQETHLTSMESLVEQGEYVQALEEIERIKKDPGRVTTSEQKADLSYLASLCLYNLGRYKEALESAVFAFETFKDTSENKKVAQIQDIRGRISLSLGDTKSAELHLGDAISTYRRIGNQSEMLKSYNLLARIYFIRGDFKKALEYLGEAKEISEKVGDHKRNARLYGNMGRVYTLLGEWEKAEKNLKVSLNFNQKGGDELSLCRDLLSLGFTKCLKRDFSHSKEFLSKALELAQKNDFLREMAIYHEYAGLLAHSENDQNTARDHFLKAIEIGQMAAPEGDINNQTYRLLAELQVDQGAFEEALVSSQKSLEISKSLGEKVEEGAAYRVLARVYYARNEKDLCSEYFTRSIACLQQVGAKYELATTYLEAGRTETFDYYKRIGFLSNAESLFRDSSSIYHLGQVNLSIAQLLLEQRDPGRAQVFFAEAETLFKQSKDHRELREVRELRQTIEQDLFQASMVAKSNGKVTFDNLVTQNVEMREIIVKLKQVMDYDISILLEGETGTGKDLLAKSIHFSCQRKDNRFVAINCAALPESLLENELFGHKRGAYTSADKDQAGLFEEAEGGTLYLDQVEEIPMPTQVKLLRAIEEKEITRLGDTKPRKINVRIISSSIEDLKEAAKNGRFRQDLYFRLNTFGIKIPPLRQRKEDIPPLVRHFLKEYGVDEKRIKMFERNGTLKRFFEYGWPGNVRELENEIKRMVVLAQAGGKDPCGFLSDKLVRKQAFSNGTSLFDEVAEFEKEKIIEALKQCNWIKLRAAKVLGIPEATLRNKMKKHDISAPAPVSQNVA